MISPYILTAVLLVGLTSLSVMVAQHITWKKKLSNLPGPRTIPLLGRIHDLPVQYMWRKLHQWADEFGPIYQTRMLNQHFVVISSEKIAEDLLSKRSKIYSDRPSVPALVDSKSTFGSGEYLPLMGRNDFWVRQRKFAHRVLCDGKERDYYGYPELECKRLLVRLAESPQNYSSLLEDFTAKTIARLAWGMHEESDALKTDAWALLTQMSPAGPKNNLLTPLNSIPLCINPWMKNEKKRHAKQREWFLTLESLVLDQMARKQAKPSWMRIFLETKHLYEWSSDAEGAYAVGMLAVAGVYTVGGPLHVYLLAMVQHPQWFQRLQHEIDDVCSDTMPLYKDSPRLPILRAIIKECLRWKPVVPTGVAHEIEVDDIYKGYLIPKGARILPLEQAFTRNEDKYPDANCFRPERWLDPIYPTYKEPLTKYPTINGHSLFGWGQRTCQGQHLTEVELITACASIAWAFDISKKKDSHGRPISPDLDRSNSLLIIKPDPFDFLMKPRTDQKKKMILDQWNHAQEQDDYTSQL